MRALLAGALYGGLAFAAGFGLGALRVMVVAPQIGPLAATLIELPIILAICWILCADVIRRLGVPARLVPRLVMGAAAFALLLSLEAVLSVGLLGGGWPAFWAALTSPPGLVGLAGQLVAAAFPLFARRS